MSKRKQESGIHIMYDVHKEDVLHPCVCPNCGNCSIDIGGKPIISYDSKLFDAKRTPRDIFTIKTYYWIPKKCTACNTRFIAWRSNEIENSDAIFAVILLILSEILVAISIFAGIAFSMWWLLSIIIAILMAIVSLQGLSESLYAKDTGIEGIEQLVSFPPEDDDELKPDFPVIETVRQMCERQDRQKRMLDGK